MFHDHDAFRQTFGAGGADVVLPQIVEHGGAHVAGDLCRCLQGKHHYRQNHLPDLELERLPIPDDVGGVIDGWQPVELYREDHDQQRAGEEGRDRKADHRDEGAGLIEDRILFVGRDDPDGQGDQDADDVGHADHPERLWHPLGDNVEDGGAGLEADNSLLAVGEIGAEGVVDPVLRLDHEELIEPESEAGVPGLTQSERLAHALFHVVWDCQRHLPHRIAGGEFQQHEDHKSDEQKRRDRQKQSADCVCQHEAPW